MVHNVAGHGSVAHTMSLHKTVCSCPQHTCAANVLRGARHIAFVHSALMHSACINTQSHLAVKPASIELVETNFAA